MLLTLSNDNDNLSFQQNHCHPMSECLRCTNDKAQIFITTATKGQGWHCAVTQMIESGQLSSLLSFHMTQLLNRNNTESHRTTRNQLSVEIRVNENKMAK